jgi:hypothetical protein
MGGMGGMGGSRNNNFGGMMGGAGGMNMASGKGGSGRGGMAGFNSMAGAMENIFGNMGGNGSSGNSMSEKFQSRFGAFNEFMNRRRNMSGDANSSSGEDFHGNLMKSILSHAIQEELRKDNSTGGSTLNHDESMMSQDSTGEGSFMKLLHNLYDPSNQNPEKHKQITEMLKNSLPSNMRSQFEAERKFNIEDVMNNPESLGNFSESMANHLGKNVQGESNSDNMFSNLVPKSGNQVYNDIFQRLSRHYNSTNTNGGNSTSESESFLGRKSRMEELLKTITERTNSQSKSEGSKAGILGNLGGAEDIWNKLKQNDLKREDMTDLAKKMFEKIRGNN